MEDFEGLPDERLAPFANTYFWYEKPLADFATVLANVVLVTMGETRVFVEGRQTPAGMTYCAVHEPAVVNYSKTEGPMFAVRLMPGAFDRLFHIDPRKANGVTAASEADHRLTRLHTALLDTPRDAAQQFRTADRVLLDLLRNAKPANLADRFVDLVSKEGGALELSGAAQRLGCSLRTLERACAARFARTPKRIARGIRAARTFHLEEKRGQRAETMAEFSYADLPHYLNDMRRITGRNRSQHAAEGERERERGVIRLWPGGAVAQGEEERARWEKLREKRYRL